MRAIAITLLLLLVSAHTHAAAVPAAAHKHRHELTRIARQEWGLDAPVSLFAAQLHQESSWRSEVRSPYAEGLAQFTPATAAWIVSSYPHLGEATPYSPTWSMRAMMRYDLHILSAIHPWNHSSIPACDRWAFTLSGYNGGPGWIARDRSLAATAGADPDRWFGHVENHTARAAWARKENRAYPHRILHTLQPLYHAAGWPGVLLC